MNIKQTEVESGKWREREIMVSIIVYKERDEGAKALLFILQFCFKTSLPEDNSNLQMQVIYLVVMEKRK